MRIYLCEGLLGGSCSLHAPLGNIWPFLAGLSLVSVPSLIEPFTKITSLLV